MQRLHLLVLVAFATGCSVVETNDGGGAGANGGGPGASASDSIVADLRGDNNRDGVVSFDDASDDDGEDSWDDKHGAIFLANIDDDEKTCDVDADDVDLPSCNDAADEIVNGADDALDLARMKTKPWAEAPETAVGAITFTATDSVRLFKVVGEEYLPVASGDALTRDEIVAGVELAIEAKDIVRNTTVWDGFVDVTLAVTVGEASASDTVRLRVAPVITYHHLLPAEETFVSSFRSSGNAALRSDLTAIAKSIGVDAPTPLAELDPWAQDFFETAFMSMPGPNGKQHVIRVALRSANVYEPKSVKNPLREAGRVAFKMRGKDVAAVQQFDLKHDMNADSLNSFGNLETIPPYTFEGKSYPLGRVLRGSIKSFAPDLSFTRMMEAQGAQPPVYVDTSWLLVGHVDETISFVKAPNTRGWVLLVNDPKMAADMLTKASTDGHGAEKMFVGQQWEEGDNAEVSIDGALADQDVMGASSEAIVEVAAQIKKLKDETGLTDAEIVKIPFLHMPIQGASIAYQPGIVNGLYMTDKDFVAPKPHGPVIDGKDLFEEALTNALAPLGVKAHFAEDWDDYHRMLGEVHCGTNATRAIPTAKWWESGK
jgi:protein-arginine deiminase